MIFANDKSSLTHGSVPVTGFKLEMNPATQHPRLVWLDDAEIPPQVNVTELLKSATKTGLVLPTKLGQIEQALGVLLDENGGWQYQTKIIESLLARGFKTRLIDEAKKRLKLKAEKEKGKGGKWIWVRPNTHPSAEEEPPAVRGNGHDPDDSWARQQLTTGTAI